MSSSSTTRGIRTLSLDGGYVNVLSALIILRELLRRIQARNNLRDIPFPFEYFDIMAGTGMGGVMLILMGRLKLSIDHTIEYCVEILERVFKDRKWLSRDSVFSATTLEAVIGEIVARHCGRADARMINLEDQPDGCRVLVCTRTADAIRAGITTCIRTYRVSANQGPDCTIVEAVRATTATPGMFKQAQIREHGVAVPYVGGGLECNNPTDRLLADMSMVFPERPVACVVSIGCGQHHSGSVPHARIYDAFLPSKLLRVTQAIATDCERTHQYLARRFEHAKDVYFRFNTEHGIQDFNRDDLTKLPGVQAHAQVYLQDASVNASMNSAVEAASLRKELVTLQSGNIVVLNTSVGSKDSNHSGEHGRAPEQDHQLDENYVASITSPTPKHSRIGRCPPPSRVFTGREDILEQMQSYFFDTSPMERRLFVLCGLGGAGKTQLALKFIQIHQDKFWDVFYIDATTRETLSAGLCDLAKAANAGGTVEEAVAWLVSQEERWLLVLNNADNPKLNLHEFFPPCTHGGILITTRNQQMRTHTYEPRSFCSVGGMLPVDALALVLRASGTGGDEHETEIASTLVKDLGYFALAIVQAGAYMRTTQCGIVQYQKLFQAAHEHLLREHGIDQTDEYGMSVIASWEISFRQLSSSATQLLHMMSFMHHEGISETFFEVACVRVLSYEPKIPLNESQATTHTTVIHFLSLLMTPTSEWNLLALKNLANQLRAFSLLDYDTHTSSYSMHPLVQEWCRTSTPNAATMRECAAWVLALCVKWVFDSDNQALRRRLLPHVLALGLDPVQTAPDVARNLSVVWAEAGFIKEGETLVAVALQASRAILGNEDPVTLTCMHNLASALCVQGKLQEAVVLLNEVIEIEKRVLTHEHPQALNSMDTLAVTYRDQGRWQESEALFLEVIEAQKRMLGPEHSDTLISMGGLAWMYHKQGQLSKAEALCVEVVETMQRSMGREDRNTMIAMHYLAMTYKAQGRLREAESLMEETVTLRKQVLGESHEDTQKSVRALEHIQRGM
ncbi:FabD/lysophospholipase-like protein [Ceratobasidium sp. AG-I]|nr:FabD/lysophospholipase-like protein [Ceratobasidium sp. AG-I]